MSNYKEILVKNVPVEEAHQTIEFEDDVPAVEAIKTVDAPVEDVAAVEALVVEPKKPSRAEKRIKDLAAEKNEWKFKAEQALRDQEDLRRQLIAGTTYSKETLKTSLEDAIKSLHSQLITANQQGETEKSVELQDKLIEAKMSLRDLTSDITQGRQQMAQPVIREQPAPQLSDKAQEWVADHPEFETDARFKAAAIRINNQLLRDGYDPNADEFYEELSQNLSKKFPEVFGVQVENDVSLSISDDSPDAEGVKSAPVAKSTQKARTSEQVVSGSSRPSGNVIQKKNSTEVQLSAADVRQAEAWGWPLEKMAKRIAHQQSNTRTDGYVPIIIPKA